MKFFEQLLCKHNYVEITDKLPKPFNHCNYPIFDSNGYWIGDYHFYQCTKCNKIKTEEVYDL